MRKPVDNSSQDNEAKQRLGRASVVQNAYDLDLMIFLHRHPPRLVDQRAINRTGGL